MQFKKFLSVVLLLCVLMSSCMVAASAAEVRYADTAANAKISEVGKDYGLMDNIQDGNILHCFCWKHTDIIEMLPEIAEAGFTSVQISPPQSTAGTGTWWWFYQPQGFYIGSGAMGNKQTLIQLCTEAEKYGIKIIADVVANHLAGDHSNIQNDLKDSKYWHTYGGGAHDGDRNSVINGTIGMPDLNTAHPYVQQCVRNYILELKECGVDGIRWDAAKHIGLPSEDDDFWPAVTDGTGIYHYGEILNNPGVDRNSEQGKSLLNEYCQYMSVTDSTYGMDLRNAFNSGKAPEHSGVLTEIDIPANKMVYWGESHDTWSNNHDWGYSNDMTQNVIDRAYAVAGSRAGATALYFSRPSTAIKDSIQIGAKGSTHFTSAEVAAVNRFRNAMHGQAECLTSGSNCTVVCREKGAVIVAGSGSNLSVSVPNGGSLVKPGTYIDEITGSIWTVTSSTISGEIGSSGIAVVYNPTFEPTVSVSQRGGTFKTDTLSLTLTLANATSGTYSINGGTAETFTGTETITIGAGVAAGSTITLEVTATDGTTTNTKTYTFIKADPNASGIYFDNGDKNWNEVYCYIYNGSGEVSKWPGTKMTNEGNNLWFTEVPEGFETCNVIFSNGSGDQTPGAQKPGFVYSGSPMIYKNGNWEEYTPGSTTPTTPPTPTKPTPTETIPTETTTPAKPEGKVLLGDVDLNGEVNIRDASTVQAYIASQRTITGKALFAADTDLNGEHNIKDAALIQKYVAAMVISQPVGEYIDYNGDIVPTDPPEVTVPTTPTTPSEGTVTIRFIDGASWGNAKAVCWKNSDSQQRDEYEMRSIGNNTFEAQIPAGYDKIYFTNGYQWCQDQNFPANGGTFDYYAGWK